MNLLCDFCVCSGPLELRFKSPYPDKPSVYHCHTCEELNKVRPRNETGGKFYAEQFSLLTLHGPADTTG